MTAVEVVNPRSTSNSWWNDRPGHKKAARKGWNVRKSKHQKRVAAGKKAWRTRKMKLGSKKPFKARKAKRGKRKSFKTRKVRLSRDSKGRFLKRGTTVKARRGKRKGKKYKSRKRRLPGRNRKGQFRSRRGKSKKRKKAKARKAKRGKRKSFKARRGKRSRKAVANPGRSFRRAMSNPTRLLPLTRGRMTVADGLGGVAALTTGWMVSGYVKTATGNEWMGVGANAGSALLGAITIKAVPLGNATTRNHLARGWMYGGLIGAGIDLGFTVVNRALYGKQVQGLSGIGSLPIHQRVKKYLGAGAGNPKQAVRALSGLGGQLIKGELVRGELVKGSSHSTDELIQAETDEMNALKEYVSGLRNGSMMNSLANAGMV